MLIREDVYQEKMMFPQAEQRQAYEALRAAFGARVRQNVPLARYTAARVGGPAQIFLEVDTLDELVRAVERLWLYAVPFAILGGGSNVLISDAGVAGVVLLNRARRVQFEVEGTQPSVWAESGANLGVVARQAAARGLAGLEWAAGIPGTIGGAVIGNAGAHGGDMAGSLIVAEILHHAGMAQEDMPRRELWPASRLEFAYRSSALKGQGSGAVVLAAQLGLVHSNRQAVQARIDTYVGYRRQTQPPGASMGSMFKNPPGDYAGRLIDVVGLKGTRIGAAQISTLHGNFFLNLGDARAGDIYALIQTARHTVAEKLGVQLELEIELLGDWPQADLPLEMSET